jgi:hypothetical protein
MGDIASVLPPANLRKLDTEFGLLLHGCDAMFSKDLSETKDILLFSSDIGSSTIVFFNRKFEQRRIVITNKEIFIALVNEEVTRELIPLLEIISVEEQGGKDEDPAVDPDGSVSTPTRSRSLRLQPSKSNSRIDPADDAGASTSFATVRHADTIKIITKEDGYNAGRSYFLQVSSRTTRLQIMGLLNKHISQMRKKAEARSKFKQSQDSVKRIINSSAFQAVSALLIVAVTPPPVPTTSASLS